MKVAESFAENRKSRIVETWKLRKVLQKTEKSNCGNLKIVERIVETYKLQKKYIIVKKSI